MNILITGTAGYVGDQLVKKLADSSIRDELNIGKVVAMDIRPPASKSPNAIYYNRDIRDKDLIEIFREHEIDVVLHLACVINPSKSIDVETMYSINVEGTRNIIECCRQTGVKRIAFASSGAAYGYYEESVNWLTEDRPIRGNEEFPYSYHKRLNEEDFAELKKTNPEIEQFIFRIGTVLGKNVNNPITDLFKKPAILGIKGSDTPFVFIWDEDLIDIFIQSLTSSKPGAYNVAGDGAVKIQDIAKKLNKKFVPIPSPLIAGSLGILKKLGVTQYGPEQIKFLKYRPVLLNTQLKEGFGYVPRKTSEEVFSYYLENRLYS